MPTDSQDPNCPADTPDLPLNRRQLLALAAVTATAALASGCDDPGETKPKDDVGSSSTRPTTAPTSAPTGGEADGSVFDAGSLDKFDAVKVYGEHRDDGFFVIRREDGEVVALSAVCTHKGCLVSPEADGSFKCFCHGSLFSPQGKVLKGPAERDLPRLAMKLDETRRVLVDTDRKLEPPA